MNKLHIFLIAILLTAARIDTVLAATRGAQSHLISCQINGLADTTEINYKNELIDDQNPEVGTDYPARTTEFWVRGDSLGLIAVDALDNSRVRIALSAQWNKRLNAYAGQMIEDDGGNEIQLNSGPVICRRKN